MTTIQLRLYFAAIKVCYRAVMLLAVLVFCGAPATSHAQDGQHGFSVWGELSLPDSFSHYPYANPDAPVGGNMVLGSLGTFNTFNPFILRGTAASGVGMIYDTLLSPYRDGLAESYGLLAESVTVIPDKREIVFDLRPEARFHDGVPVTADDVVWTFRTLLEKGSPIFRSYYGAVESVSAPSSHRVVFAVSSLENRELPLILGQISVLPRHYWQDIAFDSINFDIPLGSGPYRIRDFKPGRFVEYERVADYWGQGLPVNKGHHNIAAIRFRYFRDATVMFEAFRAGKLDFRAENVSRNWATGYDIPAVQDGRLIKRELPLSNGAGAQSVVWNLREERYADRRVREALNLAFDFEKMNDQVMYQAYTRLQSFFDNSDLSPQGAPPQAQRQLLQEAKNHGEVPAQAWQEAFRQPQRSGSGDHRRHLARAAELLKEAGYSVKNARLMGRDGQPFAIDFLVYGNLFSPLLNLYAQSLKRLGIEANIVLVEPAQYLERLREFRFDAAVLPLAHGLSPGRELWDYWGSEAATINGSSNYSGVSNGAVDYLIGRVVQAGNRRELVDAVGALDRLLTWDHVALLTYYTPNQRIAYWNQYRYPEPSNHFGTAIDLWWAIEE